MYWRAAAAFGQVSCAAVQAWVKDCATFMALRTDGLPGHHGRARTQVASLRFLHRVFQSQADWVLKGGYALEVRLRERARTTLSLDLDAKDEDDLLAALREAVNMPFGDHFFTVRTQGAGLAGPPEGGSASTWISGWATC